MQNLAQRDRWHTTDRDRTAETDVFWQMFDTLWQFEVHCQKQRPNTLANTYVWHTDNDKTSDANQQQEDIWDKLAKTDIWHKLFMTRHLTQTARHKLFMTRHLRHHWQCHEYWQRQVSDTNMQSWMSDTNSQKQTLTSDTNWQWQDIWHTSDTCHIFASKNQLSYMYTNSNTRHSTRQNKGKCIIALRISRVLYNIGSLSVGNSTESLLNLMAKTPRWHQPHMYMYSMNGSKFSLSPKATSYKLPRWQGLPYIYMRTYIQLRAYSNVQFTIFI